MTSKKIIKQMKKEEPKINTQRFQDIHPTLLKKIYIARQIYKNSTYEDFDFWLKYQDFYDGGLTLSTIAYILGMTRERIRQIEQKAIAKLRHPKFAKQIRKLYKE